jgi:DNA gyrase/topoisomerase IV subunit B
MHVRNNEAIKKSKESGFTDIMAYPDWQRLGMTGFTADLRNKLFLRCAEVAAMGADKHKPLTVEAMFIDEHGNTEYHKTFRYNHFWEFTKLYDDVNENFWGESYDRVSFEFGPSGSDSFESMSIVNSVRTDYGTHVSEIASWAAEHIRWFLNKKHKIDLKPKQIIDRMRVLSRWSIDAPEFSGQTKEVLTTKFSEFGFTPEMSQKFKQSLERSEIVNKLVDFYHAKKNAEENELIRKQSKAIVRPTAIKQLVDASSKDRMSCSLFLAEGDSAMNGIRKCRTAAIHGGFSLGGKFVNSLYRSPAQLMKASRDASKDSKAKLLMDALGLSFNQSHENMRYGNIYIMTDADYDGYCITAQLLLFFRKFWPGLFDEKRVHQVMSPIVIAKNKKDTKLYYSLEEFQVDEQMLIKNKYDIRYIKGLAAIEPVDYKELIVNPVLKTFTNDDAVKKDVKIAMSNTFGFGGHNACVLFKKL